MPLLISCTLLGMQGYDRLNTWPNPLVHIQVQVRCYYVQLSNLMYKNSFTCVCDCKFVWFALDSRRLRLLLSHWRDLLGTAKYARAKERYHKCVHKTLPKHHCWHIFSLGSPVFNARTPDLFRAYKYTCTLACSSPSLGSPDPRGRGGSGQ